MTVSTQVSREDYTGNGVTTVFPYRFRIFNENSLNVVRTDTNGHESTLLLNTDYTVNGVRSYSGGSITLISPLAINFKLAIVRQLPTVQETDIRNQGSFFPEVHEDAFDYLTMLIQQNDEALTRALLKPVGGGHYYDAKNQRIINLADPLLPQDAATKQWVDLQYSIPIQEAKDAADRSEAAADRSEAIAGQFEDLAGAVAATEVNADRSEAAADRADVAATAVSVASGVYESIERAQADINNGTIREGMIFSISDTDNDLFVALYQNVGGVVAPLLDTDGLQKSYPSGRLVKAVLQMIKSVDTGLPLVFSATDARGLRTWLEANDEDGGPSDWSLRLMMHRLYPAMINPAPVLGLSVALATANRMRTWLEANDEDGGLTPWSTQHIVNGIYPPMINPSQIIGLSIALATANKMRTWLEANDEDGGPSSWSLRLLRRQLDQYYAQGGTELIVNYSPRIESISTPVDFKPTDVYSFNGEILPVACDLAKMSGWGSSSLVRSSMVAKLTAMASSYGAGYFDGGQPGEIAQHSAARLGSVMFQLSFPSNTIPASGSVIVTVRGLAGDSHQASQLKDFSGRAAGVAGTVSYNSTAGQFQFTRTTAGSAVVLDDSVPFVPDSGPVQRTGVGLLWMGKNNAYAPLSDQVLSDPRETFKCISASFDYFSALTKRVLILGSFQDSNFIAQRVDDHINKCNALCSEKYGNLYIDVQSYLSSSQLWIDTGITPTQDDLNHQAAGRKPPSISADNGHLNEAGSTAVVNNLINPRLVSLGWYA